jgi:multicomponent Na+:H+ antiporter subunit E
MRNVGPVAVLVALWLLAWGEITLANVLSGIVVASVLLLAFPPTRSSGQHVRVNILGAARLAGYVLVQLVTSNFVMAREILRRSPSLHPGVLAHRLQRPSDEIVTVMTSVIALSPGTMTVDVDDGSTTIYVRFLLLHDVDAAHTWLARLEQLSERAITRSGPNSVPAPTKESP